MRSVQYLLLVWERVRGSMCVCVCVGQWGGREKMHFELFYLLQLELDPSSLCFEAVELRIPRGWC